MLMTVFLAIVFCGAITLLLISAVAFVQDNLCHSCRRHWAGTRPPHCGKGAAAI